MRLQENQLGAIAGAVRIECARRELLNNLSPEASAIIVKLNTWVSQISEDAILAKVTEGARELCDGWERSRTMRMSSKQTISSCALHDPSVLENWVHQVLSSCFRFSWHQKLALWYSNQCLVLNSSDIQLNSLKVLFQDLAADRLIPELTVRIVEQPDLTRALTFELSVTVTESLIQHILLEHPDQGDEDYLATD